MLRRSQLSKLTSWIQFAPTPDVQPLCALGTLTMTITRSGPLFCKEDFNVFNRNVPPALQYFRGPGPQMS